MPAPKIELPPSLAKRQTPAGQHHLGIKALFYGPPKSGKSFALASYPHPILALACGENGIELYLKPELGDISIFVNDPSSYVEALNFGVDHPDIASIVVDGINLAFEDWMAAWEAKLKVTQLEGHHWRVVKDPWKTIHRRVMNSKKHFGCSAWPKGKKFRPKESSVPGAEATGYDMIDQDAPHVEKMIPFAVDAWFKTEIELDKWYAPTPWHRITYLGGRRPMSIPANELHAGKYWRFDASKVDEVSPFDKVLKPIMDKWTEGAVEYIGYTEAEAKRELGDAETSSEDQMVGACLSAIALTTNKAELEKAWNNSAVYRNQLPPMKKDLIVKAKDARKLELGIK